MPDIRCCLGGFRCRAARFSDIAFSRMRVALGLSDVGRTDAVSAASRRLSFDSRALNVSGPDAGKKFLDGEEIPSGATKISHRCFLGVDNAGSDFGMSTALFAAAPATSVLGRLVAAYKDTAQRSLM